MDNPGWKAQRRADKESAAYNAPHREQDGRFRPVEDVTPMNGFVGGFIPPPPPAKEYTNGHAYKGAPSQISTRTSQSTSRLAHLSPVERSHIFRVPQMQPHLQLMVGPLLRYDTVDAGGMWNGFALVVSQYFFMS
ncbi:hypothetical protein HWV62_17336 [Athelia sp. TMB]|nr:hypothetical protein HWV62_33589 [Athelia sp. TMB]KAF7972657.1 hypothetical protein HWV62_17336 [Athelia sp. TMB]